jgi:hypothetical protein
VTDNDFCYKSFAFRHAFRRPAGPIARDFFARLTVVKGWGEPI